jgi:outer membrane receptor protein involved in Fe transport
MRRHIAVLVGSVAGIGCIFAGSASASDARTPVVIAQADAADAPAAGEAEPEAEPEPEPEPETPPQRVRGPAKGIEEIVIQAAESDAAVDLEAGDSVTGFDATDLEALGAQSIEDLAGFTPNLEIVTAGATTPTFFIRGVGLNDFGANSTGAVAIYQDDVPKNAPALQLGTLFDMEAVNILRGPQGTGPARNASAGAIKLYSKKPTGTFAGFLRSEIGNYNSQDYEGAVEMPVYEDLVSSRLAFRLSDRDGYIDNRCATSPRAAGPYNPTGGAAIYNRVLVKEGGFSTCGERVYRRGRPDTTYGGTSDGFTNIAEGIPTDLNDRGNWATRGTLRVQPTLDQDWLATFNLAQRDEFARVGQPMGTGDEAYICDETAAFKRPECRIGAYGSGDGQDYQAVELIRLRNREDDCLVDNDHAEGVLERLPNGQPVCNPAQRAASTNNTRLLMARNLDLDSLPYEGDYNRVGDLTNDVWGTSLKGDIAIGDSLTLTSVTGYDTYERFNEVDLDFSPNPLFETITRDEGFQYVQDLRLSGSLSQELPVNWEVGGYALHEQLDAFTDIFIPANVQFRAATSRDWTQKLWSAGGYGSFDWDFWNDFTLDGGVRYNWDKKEIDMTVWRGTRAEADPFGVDSRTATDLAESDVWQSPTGTLRLTYRFREDTHAFWKFTRGWKGGHYNVTVASGSDITTAEPEKINAFETGVHGSWFDGRLNVDTSLFHYAYEQYQIFTVLIPLAGTPEFVVLNAEDAEVYGAEVEVVARPLTGMYLEARFGWLESQFLDFSLQQAQSRSVGNRRVDVIRELDFAGNRLLNSPQFKLSLTAEQTIPLGRYGSLTGRWDGAWSDVTYYDASEGKGTPTFEGIEFLPENTVAQEAFWLHNFRLAYRTPDGSIELAAWVRNATDEVYRTYAFDASALDVNQTTVHFLGEPRTYGLSLAATF